MGKQWENIKVLFDDLGESIKLFKEGKYLEAITTLIKGLGTFFLNTIDNAITGVYNLFAKMFGFEMEIILLFLIERTFSI